jgi:hypothetical protein
MNTRLLMNTRQIHSLFNQAKTWQLIVCWFGWISLFLPVVNLKLFCFYLQNNFLFTPGKSIKFWLDWRKFGTFFFFDLQDVKYLMDIFSESDPSIMNIDSEKHLTRPYINKKRFKWKLVIFFDSLLFV